MTGRDDDKYDSTTGGVGGTNKISNAIVGGSVQANSIRGDVHFHGTESTPRQIPAQLPSSPPYFTNREREITELGRMAGEVTAQGRPLIVVITGQGGVGKTSLGLHWLHGIGHDYRDGQLYRDLLGFSGITDVTPEEALTGFLRALGVPAENVPLSRDEQAALFRSLTARRRFIVVLDNAASAAQVRPLLPGTGPSVVLVTSRLRLSGLAIEGAVFVDLRPLDDEGARELLDRMLGTARTSAEPEHVRELARLCGRLPLALCTSAARLAVRPWPIERIVRELSEERRRLAALVLDEDLSVRAVFDASYTALPAEAARMYRLLGLHPGPDFDVSLAAAAAGTNDDDGAETLDLLVGANLVHEEDNGRFGFHDLVRLHARSAAESTESPDVLDATRDRIIGHYLSRAAAADRRLIPGRRRLGTRFRGEEQARGFAGNAEALAWLESELPNILAAQRLAHGTRRHREAWEFCEALWAFFVYRKHYRIWLETHEIGLAAARAGEDPLAEARVLEQLGSAHLNLRRFAAAAEYAAQAVRLERNNRHPAGEAVALEIRGVAELALGRPDAAIDALTGSLALNEATGNARGVAIMSRRLGDALHGAGRTGESLDHLSRARDFFAADGDRYNESRTLGSIGRVRLDAGHLAAAEAALRAALAIGESIGATHQAAEVHVALADLAARRHRPDDERRHLEAALERYSSHGAPEAAAVTRRLRRLRPPGPP